MGSILSSLVSTALAGPSLRLHLLELYLDNIDMPDQALPLAQAAEQWITGTAGDDDAVPADAPVPAPTSAPAPKSVDVTAKTQHGATLKVVGQLLAAGEAVTGGLIAERLGCSQTTASRYLRDLMDVGKVVNRGSRSAPKYALVDPAAPAAEPPDDVPEAPEPVITRKVEPTKDAAPDAMPARAVLPEDHLRRMPDAGAHVDLDTVAQWLRANGCKSLTEEAPGLYSLEGAVLSDKDLLRRANKARKALKLPPFSVRGI